ncbi:MAG: hypothetical protein Q7N50_04370 [Armatimonadota bacterium]|nr:hypothetical protein [Armatimonadota bacterium]
MDFDKVLKTIKTHADTLIHEGTDTYGDIHTPMFCYQLDVKTHKPPHRDINPSCVSFDASFQSRCVNMDYDNDNFRMLYKLTEITGDKTYSDAADAYMAYFMEHCVSPTTGLFAWGEHIYYNVFTDDFNYRGHDGHELEPVMPAWDLMWEINAAAVQREFEAMWEYHVHDHIGFNFDRHAHFRTGENDGFGFIHYGGICSYSFTFLYSKIGNPEYIDWAVNLAKSRYDLRDPETGLPPGCVVRDARGNHTPQPVGGAHSTTGGWLAYAYKEHPHPLFLEAAQFYYKKPIQYMYEAGGALTGDWAWHVPPMLELYKITNDSWFLDQTKTITSVLPDFQPKGGVDWNAGEPGACAGGIICGVLLHKLTGEQKWLDIAMDKAQYATDNLFEGGLFKMASIGEVNDRYCALADAGLGYAFALLAEHLKSCQLSADS